MRMRHGAGLRFHLSESLRLSFRIATIMTYHVALLRCAPPQRLRLGFTLFYYTQVTATVLVQVYYMGLTRPCRLPHQRASARQCGAFALP